MLTECFSCLVRVNEVNMIKLTKAWAQAVHMASETEVIAATGAPVGFVGPLIDIC